MQLRGDWRAAAGSTKASLVLFLGTPIASNYFITAKHIGGSVVQTFILNGTTYTTTAVFPDPSSDLQIWQRNFNPGVTNNASGSGLIMLNNRWSDGTLIPTLNNR